MKRKHLGSNFEALLADEGILEECRVSAIKFTIARELQKAMAQRHLTKAQIARQLKTSRTGVDRLLDPGNTSITLNTLAKVAHLLGKRVEFALRISWRVTSIGYCAAGPHPKQIDQERQGKGVGSRLHERQDIRRFGTDGIPRDIHSHLVADCDHGRRRVIPAGAGDAYARAAQSPAKRPLCAMRVRPARQHRELS